MTQPSKLDLSKASTKTLVTFLLDRSSSMTLIKEATITGFNAYLETLQKEEGTDIEFTFLQFDGFPGMPNVEKVLFRKPVKDVPKLTATTFQPRGNTPLIDAAYETIMALDAALERITDKPKVVVCIQTDGEENASTAHSWEELNTLIKSKTEQGWQFNFMGAGINAYQQGARMGVAVANTMSYATDKVSTQAAFGATAANTAGFASGALRSTAYSGQQKAASGDAWDPNKSVTAPTPPAATKPKKLDLTR